MTSTESLGLPEAVNPVLDKEQEHQSGPTLVGSDASVRSRSQRWTLPSYKVLKEKLSQLLTTKKVEENGEDNVDDLSTEPNERHDDGNGARLAERRQRPILKLKIPSRNRRSRSPLGPMPSPSEPQPHAAELEATLSEQSLNSLQEERGYRPTTGRRAGRIPFSGPAVILMTGCLVLTTLCSTSTSATEFDIENREYNPDLATGIHFTAYDCSRPPIPMNSTKPEVRAIDLTEIAPCPDPEHDYLPPRHQLITIVQTHVPQKIKLYECHGRLTEKYSLHGHYSTMFGDHLLNVHKTIRLSAEVCLELHRSRTFSCPQSACGRGNPSPSVENIKLAEEATLTWYPYGVVDKEGNVEDGEFYMDRNGVKTLVKGVKESFVSLWIDEHEGQLDRETNRVWSEHLSFRGEYFEKFAWTRAHGTIAWKVKHERACDQSMAKLAVENATIYQMKPEKLNSGFTSEWSHSMVIVQNDTTYRATGMVIKSEATGDCLNKCFSTNIPYLLVCVTREGMEEAEPLPWVHERPVNRVGRLNLNGLGTYLHLTAKLDDYEVHKRLSAEICRLDTRSIRADIAAIVNGGSQYNLETLDISDPTRQVMGKDQNETYSIVVKGSVGYFMKCLPIPVELIELPVCTQQAPVRIKDGGAMSFVDPINLHLVEVPTIIECSKSLPVQYRIDDGLFCHTPGHSQCPVKTAPTILRPSSGAARGIRPSDLPALGGLSFNHEQLEIIEREQRRQELGKVAIGNLKIVSADNTLGDDGHARTIRLGIPFTDADIELVKYQVASKMFVLFEIFGQAYLHCFGLTIILSLISHALGCVVRAYYLYCEYGCGCWMPKAFFASLFSVAFLPALILKTVMETAKDALHDAEASRTRAGPNHRPPTTPSLSSTTHVNTTRIRGHGLYQTGGLLAQSNSLLRRHRRSGSRGVGRVIEVSVITDNDKDRMNLVYGRERRNDNEWILNHGFAIRDAVANATRMTLDVLTRVHKTDLEHRQLRTELLRQSVRQLNTAFGNIGRFILIEAQTLNSTESSKAAVERLIREGEESINLESARFNRSDRSILVLSVVLLVLLCALVSFSCSSIWQETQRTHRTVREASYSLQHLANKIKIVEKVSTGTHQSVVRLSLNQVYHRFAKRCDELSSAMNELERRLSTLDLSDQNQEKNPSSSPDQSTSTPQPTSSDSDSTRAPSSSISLDVVAPETPSSPIRALDLYFLEAEAWEASCRSGWIDVWDVNEINIAMSVNSAMHKNFSAFKLWEPVLKVVFEDSHDHRVVLAQYFTERVREQAIEENRSYRASDRERRIMVPTQPRALDLFYPPQWHRRESFIDPFAKYRPSPLFSKHATVFNLSLVRVLAELAEIMDKNEAMAAGDEKPRYLDLWGKVPHEMDDGTYPDKDSDEYRAFCQRLPVSAGLAYFAAIARTLFTTDQSCDCRRQHINCTICSECRRFILCPFRCRQCAIQIDYYKAIMYDPNGATPDVDAPTIQDLLYHQLVYMEEEPAAYLSIYPHSRRDKDEADNVCTRRRWQQGIVSSNAVTHYNRVLSCKKCNGTHLAIRKKTSPRPQIMGSVTYTDASPLPEEIVNSPNWESTIETCPVPTIMKSNVGAAFVEAGKYYKTQGPGRANRHIDKLLELGGSKPLNAVPLTTAPSSWYIGDRNKEFTALRRPEYLASVREPQPIEGGAEVQRALDAEVASLNAQPECKVVTYHQQCSNLGFRKVIQHLIADTIYD